MPDVLRHLIDLVEARPMTSVGVAIAVILYLQLMMSDPHIR